MTSRSKDKTKRSYKDYIFSLPKEETELWRELCNSLNQKYSHRVLALIREDIQNMLSLTEILKKKGVKKIE